MPKVKLTVIDKLFIGHLLPEKADVLTLITARDLNHKIEIKPAERKLVNLRPSKSGGLEWDVKNLKKSEKDIEFSKAELHLLKDEIARLDKAKSITSSMLGTVLKIRDIKI